jgi:uncharacterized protein (TIGR00252 family)
MSSTSIGREAETYVAQELQKQGFTLLYQNWRTRYCEIDLIMQKADAMYFIEVKYRSSSEYGAGLDYITPKKLSQIRFAAELWISKHLWRGDSILLGLEVMTRRASYVIENMVEL